MSAASSAPRDVLITQKRNRMATMVFLIRLSCLGLRLDSIFRRKFPRSCRRKAADHAQGTFESLRIKTKGPYGPRGACMGTMNWDAPLPFPSSWGEGAMLWVKQNVIFSLAP